MTVQHRGLRLPSKRSQALGQDRCVLQDNNQTYHLAEWQQSRAGGLQTQRSHLAHIIHSSHQLHDKNTRQPDGTHGWRGCVPDDCLVECCGCMNPSTLIPPQENTRPQGARHSSACSAAPLLVTQITPKPGTSEGNLRGAWHTTVQQRCMPDSR